MTHHEARAAVIAVWNASQTGDDSAIGVPVATLDALVEDGWLEEFGSPRRFFLVTEAGKQSAGIFRRN